MASTMQLEFSQAMSDFKTMFPDMDRDVIEAVLRANQGAVDATIDQLLAMSTDNQNEKIRHEMSCNTFPQPGSLINLDDNTSDAVDHTRLNPDGPRSVETDSVQLIDTTSNATAAALPNTASTLQNIGAVGSPHHNTGASPKQRPANKQPASSVNTSTNLSKLQRDNSARRWNPPLLGPLPSTFLRLAALESSRDFELPDEQFALMLQNEEFMNELRWNQEFMMALEREQHDKAKGEDDAAFKERLRNMGKMSRKKFLQLARIFTWQRNKKANTAKQIDSLPLKEEPSDDDEDHQQQHRHQQQTQQLRK